MIKGCSMELFFFMALLFQALGTSEIFDQGRIRHETLKTFCGMIKNDRIYKLADLETTCVMKVAVFDSRVCVISPESLEDPLSHTCRDLAEVEEKAYKRLGLDWPASPKKDEKLSWFIKRQSSPDLSSLSSSTTTTTTTTTSATSPSPTTAATSPSPTTAATSPSPTTASNSSSATAPPLFLPASVSFDLESLDKKAPETIIHNSENRSLSWFIKSNASESVVDKEVEVKKVPWFIVKQSVSGASLNSFQSSLSRESPKMPKNETKIAWFLRSTSSTSSTTTSSTSSTTTSSTSSTTTSSSSSTSTSSTSSTTSSTTLTSTEPSTTFSSSSTSTSSTSSSTSSTTLTSTEALTSSSTESSTSTSSTSSSTSSTTLTSTEPSTSSSTKSSTTSSVSSTSSTTSTSTEPSTTSSVSSTSSTTSTSTEPSTTSSTFSTSTSTESSTTSLTSSSLSTSSTTSSTSSTSTSTTTTTPSTSPTAKPSPASYSSFSNSTGNDDVGQIKDVDVGEAVDAVNVDADRDNNDDEEEQKSSDELLSESDVVSTEGNVDDGNVEEGNVDDVDKDNVDDGNDEEDENVDDGNVEDDQNVDDGNDEDDENFDDGNDEDVDEDNVDDGNDEDDENFDDGNVEDVDEDNVDDDIVESEDQEVTNSTILELRSARYSKALIARLKRQTVSKKPKKVSMKVGLGSNPSSVAKKKKKKLPAAKSKACREGLSLTDVIREIEKMNKRHLKDVKLLEKRQEQARKIRDEQHKNETDELRSNIRLLTSKITDISAKIDFGQKVTNATYELVLNSTDAITLINGLVKKVYKMPLFNYWFTWGQQPDLNNSNSTWAHGPASAMPETDFLFPQNFGDFLGFQKWPLIIMHFVSWLWAGLDNRVGSVVCRKAKVRTHWFLKAS